MRIMSRFPPPLLTAVLLIAWATPVLSQESKPVDFNRDVLPILTEHCTDCHGTEHREAGLRLSNKRDAFAPSESGDVAIVPKDADASPLIQRLISSDEEMIMPQDADPLSAEQIALLTRWVQEGAFWPDDGLSKQHWTYVRPKRAKFPALKNTQWPTNAVDRFALARLEAEGLAPSPREDRARLIRRVSLTLTGLPPTPAEVDAFVSDKSDDAYEKVVDRLLASKRYGERWARPWLDLARYADSNGFQADQLRDSWAYRDWVINALNADMPFDQFTVEQLAGDLLPGATIDQKIATGFHRTVTCNVEAGVHPEENRTEQIFDRVITTGIVFLGTTLDCCQCHNHKFDPFTMRDFYQIFAYFNNTPLEVEQTGGVTYDFIGPKMPLPLPAEKLAQQRELQSQLADLAQRPPWPRRESGLAGKQK